MKLLSDLPVIEIAEGLAGRIQPGEGDKVLWLHGYTIDSSAWGDMWRRLPGWHHIGIDFPGHGASQPLTQAGDLPTVGRRLGNLCRAQEIRHLVALSFGTITATQIAMTFPTSFSTVVLSAPSLAGGPQDNDVALAYGKLFQLYRQFGVGPWMREVWMGCQVWAGVDKIPEVKEELASLVERHSWEEMQALTMRHFTHPPQEESALQHIQAAVLVMIGDRELPAFRTVATTLQNVLPRCQLLELADADHLCLFQQPEAAAGAIEAHLRAHAVRPPP
jgi:pimeloyl-ACP methyl ester carboxylesterase